MHCFDRLDGCSIESLIFLPFEKSCIVFRNEWLIIALVLGNSAQEDLLSRMIHMLMILSCLFWLHKVSLFNTLNLQNRCWQAYQRLFKKETSTGEKYLAIFNFSAFSGLSAVLNFQLFLYIFSFSVFFYIFSFF